MVGDDLQVVAANRQVCPPFRKLNRKSVVWRLFKLEFLLTVCHYSLHRERVRIYEIDHQGGEFFYVLPAVSTDKAASPTTRTAPTTRNPACAARRHSA